MRLEYRQNSAYDSIVLVSDFGDVVSDWPAFPDDVRNFITSGNQPDTWEVQEHDADMRPDDYGRLIAHGTPKGVVADDAAEWSRILEQTAASLAG